MGSPKGRRSDYPADVRPSLSFPYVTKKTRRAPGHACDPVKARATLWSREFPHSSPELCDRTKAVIFSTARRPNCLAYPSPIIFNNSGAITRHKWHPLNPK